MYAHAKSPFRIIRILVATIAGLAALIGIIQPQRAQAYSGADFNAGYIISDRNFYDSNAMSVAEIQNFLAARGSYLARYTQTTETRPATSDWTCATYTGAANETAATIIFKSQQACGISAKVLLVTLQKEQRLITKGTDDGLYKAMGFRCPDTASCDPDYFGFFRQVYGAARQFAWYGRGSFTYYQVGQWNSIRYTTNPQCGSKNVPIQNAATAALYYYTPYTPNDSALANLGTTGDSCSAYGNRNFWDFYYSWFGNPIGDLGLPLTDFINIADNGGGVARAYQFGSTYQPAGGAEYVVKGPIRDAYFRVGGASGPIGWPNSNQVSYASWGGGLAQSFQAGSIYMKSGSAAYVVSGTIRDAYWSADGSAGILGWPQSDLIALTSGLGGRAQVFQYGSIYQQNGSQPYLVSGPIRDKYFTLQGSDGPLGWPISGKLQISANGGGVAQAFQSGSVYQKSGRVPYAVSGDVLTAYFGAGGADGDLGWPVSDVMTVAANGGGRAAAFENGSIFKSDSLPAFLVSGPIREKYFQVGGASGELGWPTGPVSTSSLNGGGTKQSYQNGTIYKGQNLTSRIVSGAILDTYSSLSSADGPLGWPTSDKIAYADRNGSGVAQAFTSGSIYQLSGAAAISVTGAISSKYFQLGGSTSDIGWPVSSMVCDPTSCSQDFQFGKLSVSNGEVVQSGAAIEISDLAKSSGAGSPQSGVIAISANTINGFARAYSSASIYRSPLGTFTVGGAIRSRYFQYDGANGALGWPTSSSDCTIQNGHACVQQFQNGSLYFVNGDSAARLTVSDIFSEYMRLGGPSGTLGMSTSDLLVIDQIGKAQAFTDGSIYSKPGLGVFAVLGPVRNAYFSVGGAAGSLGWPTASQSCSSNVCSQSFEHGQITWSSLTGAVIQ